MNYLLGAIPACERPAHRASYQTKHCSVLELIATLVGGRDQWETASAVFNRFGSLRDLSHASVHELTTVYGVGPSRAARIKAAIEIGQRSMATQEDDVLIIRGPCDAAKVLLPLMQDLEQEYLFVLNLNTRNRVIGAPVEVYHGSLNTSVVRMAEIFRPAIQANAAAILVAHNHPSEDITPSPEDIILTTDIVRAGKLLGIECLDHIIVGRGEFVSLKSKGLGFTGR